VLTSRLLTSNFSSTSIAMILLQRHLADMNIVKAGQSPTAKKNTLAACFLMQING
jgi:hypothetical protein